MPFSNYDLQAAYSYWDHIQFARNWWQLAAADRAWVPPAYGRFKWSIRPRKSGYAAQLNRCPITLFGLWHTSPIRPHGGQQPLPTNSFGGLIEQPLVASLLTIDKRRQDATGYLSLLQCVNDRPTLRLYLEKVAEFFQAEGVFRIIGPTGISPHIGSGALIDRWHQTTPLHSAYHPPYFAEIAAQLMRPIETRRLYVLPISAVSVPVLPQNIGIQPLPIDQLQGPLLPLLQAACANRLGFVLPDENEAEFLLSWLGKSTLHGWLVTIDEQAAGFGLLQADMSLLYRKMRGGRSIWGQAGMWWGQKRPFKQGRLLFGSVRPSFRQQGIGRLLLQHIIWDAYQRGWQRLMVGPLREDETAVRLLQNAGAQPQHTYQLYERTF